jgi:hypothetical protein
VVTIDHNIAHRGEAHSVASVSSSGTVPAAVAVPWLPQNDESPTFAGLPADSWAGTRTPDLTIMRPVQDDGGEPENVADAGERADPADAQMRFDFD